MNQWPGESMGDPLAYFLTWPTYGTWLPGDARGWVRRGRGIQPPNPVLALEARARMAEDACRLDVEQRQLVEATIAEHCRIRGWALHAVQCRTNHVHVVVSAGRHPDDVRDQFKAWCTRKLRKLEANRATANRESNSKPRERWWAERGSGRYINDLESLEAAILYVRDTQDRPH